MKWFYNWIAQGLIAEYGNCATPDINDFGDMFFRIIWRKRTIAKFVISRGKGNWVITSKK